MHRRRAYVMQADRGKKSLDERFTELADRATEFIGKWWFTAISLVLLTAWILYGIFYIPAWFTSTTWNFPANSITTLGEWFMEGLILAAANRVERRNRLLLERQSTMLANNHTMHERQLHLLEMVEALVEREQQELQRIEDDIEHPNHPGVG